MTSLLQINSSLFSDEGVSSRLADAFVARWRAQRPDARVLRRDLAQAPVPHLDAARLGALVAAPEARSVEQQRAVEETERLTRELQEADVLVLAAPMYNFGVPSQLKSWFDHIARAGVTFRYTEAGPEGLLKGKRAYVFATRGGQHKGQPQDGVAPYLQTMLNFIGIEAIEFIYAEGLSMGEAPRGEGIAAAEAHIQALLAA